MRKSFQWLIIGAIALALAGVAFLRIQKDDMLAAWCRLRPIRPFGYSSTAPAPDEAVRHIQLVELISSEPFIRPASPSIPSSSRWPAPCRRT